MSELASLLHHGLVLEGDTFTFRYKNNIYRARIDPSGSLHDTEWHCGARNTPASPLALRAASLDSFCQACIATVQGAAGARAVRLSAPRRVRHERTGKMVQEIQTYLDRVMRAPLRL